MNVNKKAVIESLQSVLPQKDHNESMQEQRQRLYEQNSERVKVEINNLIWMNAPSWMTIHKAEAVSYTILEMIFFPENFIYPTDSDNPA